MGSPEANGAGGVDDKRPRRALRGLVVLLAVRFRGREGGIYRTLH